MKTCDLCQHELHWDDAACPKCGVGFSEPRVRGALEQESDRLTGTRLALWIFFKPILAVLMLAVSWVVGESVGAVWLAVIAWVIIGLVVFVVYRMKSAGRNKQWSKDREGTKDQERLYAQFLKEHPALESSLPKERHEAFRKWVASR